jgi:hemoglobin
LSWRQGLDPGRNKEVALIEAVRSVDCERRRLSWLMDRSVYRLPITENARGHSGEASSITAAAIAAVVDRFYAKCRADELLGPVFAAHVEDWDSHLARIRAFWGAALLGSDGYAGRPLEAHLAIEGLSREHFSVWLRLFRETLEEHTPPLTREDAGLFIARAGRMANRMMGVMGERE